MIPIKIPCSCGQPYTLEVEAGSDLMPGTVTCPVCGADGTIAANAAIAQNKPAPPAVAAAPAGGLRMLVTTPPPAVPPAIPAAAPSPPALPQGSAPRAGRTDHTQAQHEARAKIIWGDPPEEVLKFLMMQGIAHEEASAMVHEMFRERAATIRANGIRKILTGIPLMAVPVVAFFIFMSLRVIVWKLFAIAIMVGLWGAWMLMDGIIKVLAPKTEQGDLADQ